MAVNSVRYHGGAVDVDTAKKSRPGSLLALARSVGEILDSFFVAGRLGKLSLRGSHRGGIERCVLHCSRGDQPALYSANDACDSSASRGCWPSPLQSRLACCTPRKLAPSRRPKTQ